MGKARGVLEMRGDLHEDMAPGIGALVVGDSAAEGLSVFFGHLVLGCGSPPGDVTRVGALQVWFEDLADFGSGAVGCEDEIGVQATASAFVVVEIHGDHSVGILDVRDVLSRGVDGLSFSGSGFLGQLGAVLAEQAVEIGS